MTVSAPAPGALTVPEDESRDRLKVRMNRIINRLADRDDILLDLVWNPIGVAGQPAAPAWFDPATALVTVNAQFALQGANPADVNPLTRVGRRKHPVLVGLACHEAGHARSTHWPPRALVGVPGPVASMVTLLEDPRIEAQHLTHRPGDRLYVRAQSVLIDLVLLDAEVVAAGGRWAAGRLAVLVLARRDAGVLYPRDVVGVDAAVRGVLGDDLDILEGLWREALALEDGDLDGLIDVATRWVDVIGGVPDGVVLVMGCAGGAAGGAAQLQDDSFVLDGFGVAEDATGEEADEGALDGDGSASGIEGGNGSAVLSAAVKEMAEAVAKDTEDAIADAEDSEPPPPPAPDPEAKQERDDAEKQATAARQLKSGPDSTGGVPSEWVKREPTVGERTLARAIGHALEAARWRAPTREVVPSKVPPGRLDSREAMQRRAQKRMGMMQTAKPFRGSVLHRAEKPPVLVGIACDTSGSMRWAEQIMSSVTWAIAHAMTYVDGKCATVTFGDGKVRPLVKPGEVPHQVVALKADGSREVFNNAFQYLDGSLNLTMGRGARLLVVFSDGQFSKFEAEAAKEAVARMRRRGGYVLWIDGTDGETIPEGAIPVVLNPGRAQTPGAIAEAIAQALVAATAYA